jgi:hypothetical protein
MDFIPNAIYCIECDTRTFIDLPTPDTECPVCLDNGREDVWCHTVVMVASCPNGEDGCESDFCNHRGEHSFDEYEIEEAEEGIDYIAEAITLPPACAKPCSECPWRRESAGGWLGPWTAEEWVTLANSDEPIACHTSIEISDVWTAKTRQCAGAAAYRKATGKLPRNPEVAVGPLQPNTFTNPIEFLDHHQIGANA